MAENENLKSAIVRLRLQEEALRSCFPDAGREDMGICPGGTAELRYVSDCVAIQW
jgi:hypothetical protein